MLNRKINHANEIIQHHLKKSRLHLNSNDGSISGGTFVSHIKIIFSWGPNNCIAGCDKTKGYGSYSKNANNLEFLRIVKITQTDWLFCILKSQSCKLKITDKWSLSCFRSILKILHSHYLYFFSNLPVKFAIFQESSILFNSFYCLFCL